jgi:PDDEXK-like domain of unknown function (DUF3799)
MTLAPGIYELAEATYHADPCDTPSLSASIIKVLLERSPLHAWTSHPRLNPNYREAVSSTFDLGTASHDLFLRGLDDTAVIIDAPDWRTKDAQAARDAAREQGLIPLLAKDAARVQALVGAIRDQLAARDDDPPLFDAGKPEQTIVWREKDVLCRARLDWLHDDMSAVDDLKSTGVSGNPHDWGRRTFWSIGGDVQAQLYRRGIKALTGDLPDFRFAVIENQAPHCLSVLDLAPSAIELADHKIDTALEIWKRCLDSGVWPGYPDGIASVEVTWQEADHLMRHWEAEEVA